MQRGDIIIFPCVLCLSKRHTALKKNNEKNVFKNLTKMLMSRNEFGDGIALATGWFRML